MNINSFSGNPKTEWLPNGRDMRLLEAFSFADTERIWTAPAGAIINGASIPKMMWSLIGSPFVGRYRNASVLHDYYFTVRTEPTVDVNHMFYKAMLASGVSVLKANIMWDAVNDFGIIWDENGDIIERSNTWDDDDDEIGG